MLCKQNINKERELLRTDKDINRATRRNARRFIRALNFDTLMHSERKKRRGKEEESKIALTKDRLRDDPE